jgi:hypothetical protein
MAKEQKSLLDAFRSHLQPERNITSDGADLIRLLDGENGWEDFLKTLGPNTFSQPFASYHKDFWEWFWRLAKMRRDKQRITKEDLTFLAGWSRGVGKSSAVEWACITEGALGLKGYVLYVSLTQASANSHVADIRKRLESEEIIRYFPDLAEPMIGRHNNRYGWNQEFLVTKGGWAIRPIGLDVAVRGVRVGDLRPTLIVFDDIDDHNLSAATVAANISTISRSILPAGTPSTIHLLAQNLIGENTVVNQIYTGKADILTEHVASVHPAFEPESLQVEKIVNEKTGKHRYEIVQCQPTWEGMDIEAARVNLNKVGIEAFYAEYQHDFSFEQNEKVIPEFDDSTYPPVHVIGWDQFEEKFKSKRVPEHWQKALGLDIGYTNDHIAAWTWMTMSSEDSVLPNALFVYRGRCYTGKSLNEMVDDFLPELLVTRENGTTYDERDQYIISQMSHEKLGEQMILNREYEFNFGTCNFRKEDGVAQWREYLRCDKRLPHPFHPDELLPDGKYKLGRPTMFYVVDPEQLFIPRDDAGLAIHRAQVRDWKRRQTKLTSTGMTTADPLKWKDDANDSTRMLLAEEYLTATPLTALQRKRLTLQDKLRADDLTLKPGQADYGGVLMRRQMEWNELKRKEQEELETIVKAVRGVLEPPPFVSRHRR